MNSRKLHKIQRKYIRHNIFFENYILCILSSLLSFINSPICHWYSKIADSFSCNVSPIVRSMLSSARNGWVQSLFEEFYQLFGTSPSTRRIPRCLATSLPLSAFVLFGAPPKGHPIGHLAPSKLLGALLASLQLHECSVSSLLTPFLGTLYPPHRSVPFWLLVALLAARHILYFSVCTCLPLPSPSLSKRIRCNPLGTFLSTID